MAVDSSNDVAAIARAESDPNKEVIGRWGDGVVGMTKVTPSGTRCVVDVVRPVAPSPARCVDWVEKPVAPSPARCVEWVEKPVAPFPIRRSGKSINQSNTHSTHTHTHTHTSIHFLCLLLQFGLRLCLSA